MVCNISWGVEIGVGKLERKVLPQLQRRYKGEIVERKMGIKGYRVGRLQI